MNLTNRLIELKVIQGAAAANPQRPTYNRTSDIYDLVLAEITVPAGAIELEAAHIKDTRPDNSLCGFVTGVVNQIDTSILGLNLSKIFLMKILQGT